MVRLYSGFMLETITLGNNPKNKAVTDNAIESPFENIAIFDFFLIAMPQLIIKNAKAAMAETTAILLLNKSV